MKVDRFFFIQILMVFFFILFGLIMFTANSVYDYYYLGYISDLTNSSFLGFLILLFIILILTIVYFIGRNSSHAERTAIPLNLFLIIISLIALIPFSNYPPFEFAQSRFFEYDTDIGLITTVLIGELILVLSLVLRSTSYYDRIFNRLSGWNISKIYMTSIRTRLYSFSFRLGFLSVVLSFSVIIFTLLFQNIVPTVSLTPSVIISLVVFFSLIGIVSIYLTIRYFRDS